MKKYIAPKMEIVEVKTEHLMNMGSGESSGGSGTGNPRGSRSVDDFEDEK